MWAYRGSSNARETSGFRRRPSGPLASGPLTSWKLSQTTNVGRSAKPTCSASSSMHEESRAICAWVTRDDPRCLCTAKLKLLKPLLDPLKGLRLEGAAHLVENPDIGARFVLLDLVGWRAATRAASLSASLESLAGSANNIRAVLMEFVSSSEANVYVLPRSEKSFSVRCPRRDTECKRNIRTDFGAPPPARLLWQSLASRGAVG